MPGEPYLDAVRRLAGHDHFQAFQDFCLVVAGLHWPDRVIRKPQDPEGLCDILVHDAKDPQTVVAQVECKATMHEGEVQTLARLKRVAGDWKVRTLNARRLKGAGSPRKRVQSYIATTAAVRPGLWQKHRRSLGLSGFDLWDAHVLSSFLRGDCRLATYLDPQLPIADAEMRTTSLELMVIERDGKPIGVPEIMQVISEDDTFDIDFSEPILIAGPPNVGKTCCALRAAWRWYSSREKRRVLYFNCRLQNDPVIVQRTVRNVARGNELLILVDDVHFARDAGAWRDAVAAVSDAQPGTRVIWIARDDSPRNHLAVNKPPQLFGFPVEQVFARYFDRLTDLPPWQRLIAAFEAKLNPRFARKLERAGLGANSPGLMAAPATDEMMSEFRYTLKERMDEEVRELLADAGDPLGNHAPAYHLLLPFGALGVSAPLEFLSFLGLNAATASVKLRHHGLARVIRDTILLTEHPFQLRRTLAVADRHLTEETVRREFLDNFAPHRPEPWSVMVLSLYLARFLTTPDRQQAELNELGSHAEWSGVREPLTACLRFLLRHVWTTGSDLRSDAVRWYRKLARSSWPDNDDMFDQMLSEAANDWRTMLWEGQTGFRRDTILYEIAYIDYLKEDYAGACDGFAASVDAGLQIISEAMCAGASSPLWEKGQAALSHIWIAALLERSAKIRGLLRTFVEKCHSSDCAANVVRCVDEIAGIRQALCHANGQDGAESAGAYLDALRAVRPDWNPPENAVESLRREPGMESALARHEYNARLHATEASCWPMLYGLLPHRVPTQAPPPPRFALPAPAVAAPKYRESYINTLVKWSTGAADAAIAREAIATATLLVAGGAFEYLGDALLLALRVPIDPQLARAIRWYVKTAVPTIGFNGLAKASAMALS